MVETNKIEIMKNGIIQIRELEILELADGTTKDGEFSRYILTPNISTDGIKCPKVKAIAIATWTDEVIQAYIDELQKTQI